MGTPRRSPSEIANAWRASSRSRFDGEVENPTLRDVLRAMGDIRSSMEDMRNDLRTLQETVAVMQQQPSPSTQQFQRVPLELSARVRRIHRGLGEELQWRVGHHDSFRSPHNEEVTKAIVQAIKDSGESWGPESLLRKACNRFFENLKSQRRMELAGRTDDVKNRKKLNSRHERLFKQRLLVARDILEEEDLEYMKGADASLMSDEESGEEDKGMYVVLPPRWRSARLSRVLQRCQLRLEENGRLGRKPASVRRRVIERGRVSCRACPANKANYTEV